MKTDTRTVDDLLTEAEVEYVQPPRRRGDQPSQLDRQTLALGEALLEGESAQRTLAYQPQNLGLVDEANFAGAEEKQPPKGEVSKLVQAFALKKISGENAPIKAQQRLHDAFSKVHGTICKKYPHIDFNSSSFWSNLEDAADKWLKTRPTSGPGKDW